MGRMTYVQRRANRYEFRYRLPDDLAGKTVPARLPSSFNSIVNASAGCFKREIIKSLGTNNLATANRKVLSHIAEAQREGGRENDHLGASQGVGSGARTKHAC